VVGYSTPEPGTLVMLGTGILLVAGALRRKLL
jgi:PEP-CTERM motif